MKKIAVAFVNNLDLVERVMERVVFGIGICAAIVAIWLTYGGIMGKLG